MQTEAANWAIKTGPASTEVPPREWRSPASAGEPGLTDGGEQRAVGEVDPAVFDGETVVRVEGVHARGEARAVRQCPRTDRAVDLDRVFDRHGSHWFGDASEHRGREVIPEHREPG